MSAMTAPRSEPPPAEEVGGGRAQREHERVRDQAGLESDPNRIECDVAAERFDQLRGRDLEKERQQRQEEERERHSRGHREHEVEGALHGSPKPASSSACCPSSLSTSSTNAWAASRFSVSLTTAIGYSTTAWASWGSSIASSSSRAAL